MRALLKDRVPEMPDGWGRRVMMDLAGCRKEASSASREAHASSLAKPALQRELLRIEGRAVKSPCDLNPRAPADRQGCPSTGE
jgi:hypothetical protein